MAFNPEDYSPLTIEEMGNIGGVTQGKTGLQVETCSGSNCGDALANYLNSGPLKDTGVALPRGGIGPGDLASVGKSRGAAVYGRENLSLESLTPGTVIHMTRQPGDRNYEYGKTHIGIVDTDESGGQVFKSFTAGKGWRTEPVDRNFIERLPAQITATNPVNPGSGGFFAGIGDWLGPNAAEAAEKPEGGVRPGFNPADYSIRPGFNPDDYSPAGEGVQAGTPAPLTPEPPTRDEYLESVQGLDLGAGIAPPAPGRREPGIYDEGPVTERNLVNTVKDYLGYRELPAFLPVMNEETGLWQAQDIYEARKLYHGWDDSKYSELDRVIYHGVISPLTFGVTDYFAKELTAPVPAPETATGAVASGALGFASFMRQPFKLAEGLLGTRLAPTRTGLRGIVQVMAQGGASLGLATSLSSLAPSLANNDNLTEAGLEFVKGSSSGALIGLLFPLAGAVPTLAMRMAGGLAALDFVKTRFHAAPDQGYFTLDDVYRGVRDGSIDRTVLAQKTFDYLMDLYFLGKTPSMKKQLEGLRANAMMAEAAKVNPQEAEDGLVAIGKSGTLNLKFGYQKFPLTESPQYAQEFARQVRKLVPEISDEQAAGLLKENPRLAEGDVDVEKVRKMLSNLPEPPPSPQPSPTRGEGEEGVQAGKPAPLEPAAQEPWKKPWELSADEYAARKRALTMEGRPEPNAAKIAKLREIDVRHALKRGGPVPPEVLADYPELAERYGRKLPPAEAKAGEVRDPYQEAIDQQRKVLEAVEAKIGRARSDKTKMKLGLDKKVIQEEIARLQKIVDEKPVSAYGEGPMTSKPSSEKTVEPEPPDYAFIEAGDLILDSKNPETGGYVLREAVKEGKPGFVVDQDGRERFIGREEARVMGLEEQERLLEQGSGVRGQGLGEGKGVQAGTPAPLEPAPPGAPEGVGPGKMYSGGPGVEEIQEYGRQLKGLGERLIDAIDKRLERNLPPELMDPDASDIIGKTLLRLQMFEDIGNTYPEARKTFEAARKGLALTSRLAGEAHSLFVPYANRLNPEERARVDAALVKLDLINDPGMGRSFRLGDDLEHWQRYLLNPREDLKQKGIEFYMSRGLSETEAAGAFGVRMGLDYYKALQIDFHTRNLREWLEAHGFDRGKINDIMDFTLHTESPVEDIAKIFFGADHGKSVPAALKRFRESMQYWLKETNHYIPHQRYGKYFIRVIDTAASAKAKGAYKRTLEAIDRRYPKDRVDVEATLKQSALEFMEAPEGSEAGETPAPRKMSKADRLRAEAREEFQDAMKATVIHATAAQSRAQYHERRAALEAEFPAEKGFLIKEKLNKQLPMEIYTETDIPRVWKIITDAANTGNLQGPGKDDLIEGWQDYLAAKGAGAHFIKRWNVPGYETDLLRPLANYFSGVAGYLGKAEKIRGFSEAFKEVPKEMPNLMRHLNEYANYVLSNPNELQAVRNVIYNWTLGGNLSFHFINSLQNLAVGWPVLGTVKVEGRGPMKELKEAYLDWTGYMMGGEGQRPEMGEGLRPGEEAVLARARFEPELAPSGVAELSGKSYSPLHRWLHNDPTSLASKGIDVFKGFWSGAFVEQMNRETFFLAAYRRTGDYDQAIELTRKAHFLYGKETRPAVIRGQMGSMMGIFLTYTTNYLTLVKNFGKAAMGVNPEVYGSRETGATALTRMLAGALLMGGITGTGLWPVIRTGYEAVFGSNIEEDGKDYLQATFGISHASAAMLERTLQRGLLAGALEIDIGSRIAPNLPVMSSLPDGKLSWQNLVGAVLGAGSIPAQTIWSVGYALGQGEKGRALEAASPVSVRNLLAAIRLSTEGATTMKGQPIFTAEGEPLKLTPGEAIKKGMGFQPVRLAEHYSKERHARRMEDDRRDRAQGFAGDLARAIRNEDEAGFQRTIDEWVAYNNKMLEAKRYADVIKPQSVLQAVKSRFKPKYPDVSQKQMILRDMGRNSLADTISPENDAIEE